MASKSAPAKKKPPTTSNDTEEPLVTTVKKTTCKNLNGTATLTYHIGLDNNSTLQWKIHSNSGNGMFSDEWIAFSEIQQALDKWPKESPIVSMTLYPLFNGKSVNTPSFLLASLINEGILQQVPGKKRHYRLGNAKPFLAEMNKLAVTHSRTGKAKPKAKAKAAACMKKSPAKAATAK